MPTVSSLSQEMYSGNVLLSVVPNRAVREVVANAEQSKALGHLLIIEKGLIGLVHFPGQQLASAGAAGARPTGIGKIDALLYLSRRNPGARSGRGAALSAR